MNIKPDPRFKDRWIIDQDGNKIAQFFPCVIDCCVNIEDIRGGEGHPIIYRDELNEAIDAIED